MRGEREVATERRLVRLGPGERPRALRAARTVAVLAGATGLLAAALWAAPAVGRSMHADGRTGNGAAQRALGSRAQQAQQGQPGVPVDLPASVQPAPVSSGTPERRPRAASTTGGAGQIAAAPGAPGGPPDYVAVVPIDEPRLDAALRAAVQAQLDAHMTQQSARQAAALPDGAERR